MVVHWTLAGRGGSPGDVGGVGGIASAIAGDVTSADISYCLPRSLSDRVGG